MIQKIKTYFPYIVIGIIIILWGKSCIDSEKDLERSSKNWAYKEQMYLHNESTLMRDTTAKGEELVIQKQLVVSSNEAQQMAIIENTRLKKVNSEVRVITTTRIEKVFIPIVDTFIIRNGDTIRNARIFWVNNKWYGINGTVLEDEILIDSMYFNNELVVTLGYEKQKGLFKKDIPVVDIINKNPYSRINEVYNVTIEPRKKRFYEKTWFHLTVGALGGFYVNSKLK